jgi:hypothetical protein
MTVASGRVSDALLFALDTPWPRELRDAAHSKQVGWQTVHAVWLRYVTHRNADGLAWPSAETISRQTDLPLRTVNNARDLLVRLGLLRRVDGFAARGAVRYFVEVPGLDSSRASPSTETGDGAGDGPGHGAGDGPGHGQKRTERPKLRQIVQGTEQNGTEPNPQKESQTKSPHDAAYQGILKHAIRKDQGVRPWNVPPDVLHQRKAREYGAHVAAALQRFPAAITRPDRWGNLALWVLFQAYPDDPNYRLSPSTVQDLQDYGTDETRAVS